MKKLVFLFATLFLTVGMAFGQNNSVSIEQISDGNEAVVDQVGTNHTALVDQEGLDGIAAGEAHYASIDQRGLDGEGSGDNNYAKVIQTPSPFTNPVFHTSLINQWGNDNTAYAEQIGNQSGNNAYIDQNGDDNTAGVYQHHGNTFYADQAGDHNTIEGVPGGGASGTEPEDIAYQQGGSASSAQYVMDFSQVGDNNLIQALQQRGTGGGLSTITQTGDWNTALSFQNRGDGLYDQITITQNGFENEAVVHQTQ